MLFKLVGEAGVDGVMARVVGTRCDLVDEDFSVRQQKQLYTKDACAIEGGNGLCRDFSGGSRNISGHTRRGEYLPQDAVLVDALGDGVDGKLSIQAARDHHRQLLIIRRPCLRVQGFPAEVRKSFFEARRVVNTRNSAPV